MPSEATVKRPGKKQWAKVLHDTANAPALVQHQLEKSLSQPVLVSPPPSAVANQMNEKLLTGTLLRGRRAAAHSSFTVVTWVSTYRKWRCFS